MIKSPKLSQDKIKSSIASIYPYYAGYSEDFVHSAIQVLGLDQNSLLLDPWNGSGTTSFVAAREGLNFIGYDLNPVMVIVSRAKLISPLDWSSLVPLAIEVIEKSHCIKDELLESDPLHLWFKNETVLTIRALEKAIRKLFVNKSLDQTVSELIGSVEFLSPLYCIFVTALFNVVRLCVESFRTSNPTWIKLPKFDREKVEFSDAVISSMYLNEINRLSHIVKSSAFGDTRGNLRIDVSQGDSRKLSLATRSIDAVITSPPYCTRIDYARATLPELAVLGISYKDEFKKLRSSMMGTSTVSKVPKLASSSWGRTCLDFIERLETHSSKASNSYYLKNHLKYFDDLYRSIGEIGRTLKVNGKACVVVQDSYYKEMHNDLPKIVVEMAEFHGLALEGRYLFPVRSSMRQINRRAKEYVKCAAPVEAALIFRAKMQFKGDWHENNG